MEDLSDEVLDEAYTKAKKLHLDSDFIQLLEEELTRRSMNTKK